MHKTNKEDKDIKLDCQNKDINSDGYFEGETPINFTVTDMEDRSRVFHNHNTCDCNNNTTIDQDGINKEVGRKIIEDIENARKEMSLETHHTRLNSLENIINFISGPDFIKYIREQIKDINA